MHRHHQHLVQRLQQRQVTVDKHKLVRRVQQPYLVPAVQIVSIFKTPSICVLCTIAIFNK